MYLRNKGKGLSGYPLYSDITPELHMGDWNNQQGMRSKRKCVDERCSNVY